MLERIALGRLAGRASTSLGSALLESFRGRAGPALGALRRHFLVDQARLAGSDLSATASGGWARSFAAGGTFLSRKLRREARAGQGQSDLKRESDGVDEAREPSGPRESAGEATKGIRVGLIGAPNAGKSLLTNVLLGRKVTAVSGKVNTTTAQTFGVTTTAKTQLVIFDTPGVVDRAHYRSMKQRERVTDAYATAALCDALVFVVDAERQMRKPDPRVERLIVEHRREIESLDAEASSSSTSSPSTSSPSTSAYPPTSILALNKTDLVRGERKSDLLDLARRLNDLGSFDEIFMISSLKRTGVQDLIQYLESNARQRPWQMADSESSHNYETFAVELVKEQVYRRLNAEIPYVLEIKPVSCKFLRDGSLRIEQDLMVDHVKKKKIVVGKRGQAIGQIGCRARTELQRQLKLTVHLILNVKVRKGSQVL